MMLYLLEPEVAGELGENTRYENYDEVGTTGAPPVVSHLHYNFTGWLGDELLECTPCFIVSKNLANAIQRSSLRGYKLENAETTISDEFAELHPKVKLPDFVRLIAQGQVEVRDKSYRNCNGTDFFITNNSYLVVSQAALEILEQFSIKNCDITPLIEK